MFRWISHSYTERIIRIEGVVENVEPLRIGAGKVVALHEPTDLVVVKAYDPERNQYVPLIPGSSWKGLFRAAAVRLLRTHNISVCDGVPRSSCLRGNEFDPIEREGGGFYEKLNAILHGEISCCVLCLMFGAPGLASHISFLDSYPVSNFRLGYRTMIAIDRRAGASARASLFTIEYIEPGTQFNFGIELFNMPNYCIGIISQIILDLHNGILRVGGFKSRGFGGVKFNNLSFKVIFPSEIEEKNEMPALDPYDKPVKIEKDPFKQLQGFVDVWREVSSKLAEISKRGWKWL